MNGALMLLQKLNELSTPPFKANHHILLPQDGDGRLMVGVWVDGMCQTFWLNRIDLHDDPERLAKKLHQLATEEIAKHKGDEADE